MHEREKACSPLCARVRRPSRQNQNFAHAEPGYPSATRAAITANRP
jgi:hypothetical protein